ncbi:MAG TPA: universal stress protein [Bacteroidales bacterium]|nr:universal stress protein [Bacteroidales bacterium]
MAKAKQETKYNNIILIPTDFSEVAGNAVSHGVKLAKYLGFKVFILHIINKETKAELKKIKAGIDYIDQRLKDYKKYYAKRYDVEIDTMAVEGTIFSTINMVSKEIGANLMVMGTHGKKGLQHVFGSYAMRVVEESTIPVVVVQKRAFKAGYKNIVFPVSNDLEPRQAVQWAKLMSRLFKAKIHMVVQPEKDVARRTALTIITRQITTVFDSEKMNYSITMAEPSPGFAEQVISYSVLHNADLIMIMTRPNIEYAGFSLASWDERLMFNEAQIPVMGINPIEYGYHYYEW